MRIFLLPLTTRQALVYYQRTAPRPGAHRGILEKVNFKAAETWAKWERAEKGWQKTVVTYGNQALQRIPYQEWSLKSFPSTNADLQAKLITDTKTFDVIYPGNVMDRDDVPKVLSRLARERKQLHSTRFWSCLIGLPFTIPFALIPVIPNLPFFYLAYRCWSHWKALMGSNHLDFLLDHRLLRFVSTPPMESIYTKFAPYEENTFDFVTRTELEQGTVKPERRLLPAGAHSDIAQSLEVPELSGEVERALWQIDRAAKQKAAEQTAKAKKHETDAKHEQ